MESNHRDGPMGHKNEELILRCIDMSPKVNEIWYLGRPIFKLHRYHISLTYCTNSGMMSD